MTEWWMRFDFTNMKAWKFPGTVGTKDGHMKMTPDGPVWAMDDGSIIPWERYYPSVNDN